MHSEWETETEQDRNWTRIGTAGMGVLRVALLFGSVAVALALIVVPIADQRPRPVLAQANLPFALDRIVTSSTSYSGEYAIRRSVQKSPAAVCITRDNGDRSGDC
ncbi:hypothetical protein L598_000700000360 [Mesorhizobium sp. J18]|uniref:hypothetical protein n=1 Tax=Mesorhizobium sp. J18 TaxID=935263 RepID=UPI00119A71F7|nr:hypothetical protein [Mesorhizobium sp. J18]TWG90280.1 hypothetical protein L598_000700000360 [Mesorhizobium sp. J18]